MAKHWQKDRLNNQKQKKQEKQEERNQKHEEKMNSKREEINTEKILQRNKEYSYRYGIPNSRDLSEDDIKAISETQRTWKINLAKDQMYKKELEKKEKAYQKEMEELAATAKKPGIFTEAKHAFVEAREASKAAKELEEQHIIKQQELERAFSDDNMFVYSRSDIVDGSGALKKDFYENTLKTKKDIMNEIKTTNMPLKEKDIVAKPYGGIMLPGDVYNMSLEKAREKSDIINTARDGKDEAMGYILKDREGVIKKNRDHAVKVNKENKKLWRAEKGISDETLEKIAEKAKENVKSTAKNATESAAKGEAKSASKKLAEKVLTKGNIAAGVGLALGGYLVLNMFDKKGQQSNAQLYGQQGY